jgi:hypothetical protein
MTAGSVRKSALAALEIGLIVFICLISTRHLQPGDADQRIGGNEFSYLINSGTIAADMFRRSGSIPLWNPFLRQGEPLLENPFSFVLNPLMTLPLWWWGEIDGSKASLVLHIALAGVGGWVLGVVVRLRGVGRCLLGLALAGNGSIAGAISGGFYQMALTQTYIPWVLAGMIGTLTLRERWPVGLLVVATTLMMFGGTFWYVLPMAITCGLLALFQVRYTPASLVPTLPLAQWRRLLLAGAFIVMLGMVRLLPQFAHRDFVTHPEAIFERTNTLESILSAYFSPLNLALMPGDTPTFMFYHFALPAWFAVGVALLRGLLIKPWHGLVTARGRVVWPLLLSILLYSLWAQERTPFNEWLYGTFTFFSEWRFLARMMAAATPLVIIVVALWFDDLAGPDTPDLGWRAWAQRGVLHPAVSILLAAAGGVAALDVQANWRRVAFLEDASYMPGVRWLRDEHPNQFLSIMTIGFFDYLAHWQTLSRAAFGNPDYQPKGRRSTLGSVGAMPILPEWAVGTARDYTRFLEQRGFQPVIGSPIEQSYLSVWYGAQQPAYAFLVGEAWLRDWDGEPLTRPRTRPVSYFHRLDSILVTLTDYAPGSVLVVQEVAYPGWQVAINGAPGRLESVGELLGVVLPPPPPSGPTLATPVTIEFTYHPREFYVGAVITISAAVWIGLYLLRIDLLIGGRLPPGVGTRTAARAGRLRERLLAILTDERLLAPKYDED